MNSWTRLPDGSWGICVPASERAGPGDRVTVRKRNNTEARVILGEFVGTKRSRSGRAHYRLFRKLLPGEAEGEAEGERQARRRVERHAGERAAREAVQRREERLRREADARGRRQRQAREAREARREAILNGTIRVCDHAPYCGCCSHEDCRDAAERASRLRAEAAANRAAERAEAEQAVKAEAAVRRETERGHEGAARFAVLDLSEDGPETEEDSGPSLGADRFAVLDLS